MDTCYMCERKATSSEHIPPRCLFPERKDSPRGIDYRKNLITVPSCDIHNTVKSKDDEFLMLTLLSIGGNLVSQRQFSKKGMRAIKRKPTLLGLFKNPIPALYNFQPTASFTLDKSRFDKLIDQLCRGLYFNQFGRKWESALVVFSPSFIAMPVEENLELNRTVRERALHSVNTLASQPIIGENKDVFYFKILTDKNIRELLLLMVFYGNIGVIATNTEPIKGM